jgi:hypothetical protein
VEQETKFWSHFALRQDVVDGWAPDFCLNLKKCAKKRQKKSSTKMLVRRVLLTGNRTEGKVKIVALMLKYQ